MIHRLHTHPKMERLLNLPADKVIVDTKFIDCFEFWDVHPTSPNHIIVNKSEFEKCLKIEADEGLHNINKSCFEDFEF